MYQIDIKRLLAYSTISHCGFLFVSTLNGNINHTLVYLFLHGIFKAISFMVAGRFIQQLETQDLRLMSQVFTKLPFDTVLFIFSIFNLAALPGTMGIYYKSLFLSSILVKNITIPILALNFLGCLTGVGYFLHVLKIFFSLEIKLPKYIMNKFDSSPKLNSNMISLFIFFGIA
jgi:NADH:ubiquinone oxidoreductase subunit 5 (subunit L)/multisubunit Na+/H+ antiporter MnhA subunit